MTMLPAPSAPTVSIAVHDPHVDWREGPPLPSRRAHTACELIAESRSRFGDCIVLRDGGLDVSWNDLDAWSARLASAWAGYLPRGERCAVLLPNGLAHLLCELACWRLGAIAAPIFTGFGSERIAALLERLAAQVVVVADARQAPRATTAHVSDAAAVLAIARGAGPRNADRAVTGDDPCLIQFTSGSSGLPRGVVLTHDNLASQQAAFALHWPEVGPGDRLAAYLPWHHSFGGLAERWWSLCRGADLTVVPGGGRDRAMLMATVRAVRPTVFLSVPKIHALCAEERLLDPRVLRFVFTAGAPLPGDLRRWYADAGIALCEGWGLTETSPSCTLTRPGCGRDGIVGWPIAGVAVGVRRADGRLLVRGPNVMPGYFRQPSTTLVDGVLDTGDLGAWESDGLRLRGRADHQLKLGNGEKVCAAALEAHLVAELPALRHVVIAAEPDLMAIIDCAEHTSVDQVHAAVAAVNARQPVPYQRIVAVYRTARRLCVEDGNLTASLKVARGAVLDAWRRWHDEGGEAFERVW
jgi:long-subunit acyl-CoA synthetase (AMP-forming)